jgi:hypothetical protein
MMYMMTNKYKYTFVNIEIEICSMFTHSIFQEFGVKILICIHTSMVYDCMAESESML